MEVVVRGKKASAERKGGGNATRSRGLITSLFCSDVAECQWLPTSGSAVLCVQSGSQHSHMADLAPSYSLHNWTFLTDHCISL
jgi:hypothetical protein